MRDRDADASAAAPASRAERCGQDIHGGLQSGYSFMIARSGVRQSLNVPARHWSPAVVPTVLVFVPILLIYLYFITGGDWSFSKVGGSYYDEMGDAFASGQLAL